MTPPLGHERIPHVVTTTVDLVDALRRGEAKRIAVRGHLAGAPTLRLQPGQELVGDGRAPSIEFFEGLDGVQLTFDNAIERLGLIVSPARRAICCDLGASGLGELRVRRVSTAGRVQLEERGSVRSSRVQIEGLDVVRAEGFGRGDPPGTSAPAFESGAFQFWSSAAEPELFARATITDLRLGRENAPIRGSGVVLGADLSSPLRVDRLELGPIYVDGTAATGDRPPAAGAVVLLQGAEIEELTHRGPVETRGPRDAALVNWGAVHRWTSTNPVVSQGEHATGFANYGRVGELRLLGGVETFGEGSRGFDLESGGIAIVELGPVTTHADAATGVRVRRPIGRLVVHGAITTEGNRRLPSSEPAGPEESADGVDVLPEGSVGEFVVEGGVITRGDRVASLDVQGEIAGMRVVGGIRAFGGGSDAVRIQDGRTTFEEISLTARTGVGLRLRGGSLGGLRDVSARGGRADILVERETTIRTTARSITDLERGFGNAFQISGGYAVKLRRPEPPRLGAA